MTVMPQSLALVLVHVIFSTTDSVVGYIANQEMQHHKMTFQKEFRAFLNKHGARFGERHIWDQRPADLPPVQGG